MIFKRLSASAARFNLRQSMQNLRDNAYQDEVLISENGDVNPNKQRYMRQIVIDFGFLIEHWEIENKNPSKSWFSVKVFFCNKKKGLVNEEIP